MIIISFLIVIGVLSQKQEEIDKHVELEIGKLYEFYGRVPKKNQNIEYPTHFYNFTINEIIKNEDLFVILRAKQDRTSYPALYISKTNRLQYIYNFIYYSPSQEDGDSCGLDGLDLCSIESENIIQNATYYLGVYCLQDCRYTLQIHYQIEQDINLGDNMLMQFEGSTERLIKIQISQSLLGIDRIIVRAHLILEKGKTYNETFHFYINEGNNDPTPTHYDYIADEIWAVGKGVVIQKNSTNLQIGTNLTVLFESFEGSKILVITQFYEEIRQVKLFERIDDLVPPNDWNTYELIVEDQYLSALDKNSLSIDVHPYEGNPDIYLTPPPLPESLEEYKWQSQLDLGLESITISPRDRDQYSDDSRFYLTIKGNEQYSSYSFYIYISNYLSRILMPLSTESGFLMSGERMDYEIYIYEYLSNYYTINAYYPMGSAYLVLKKCIKNADEVRQVTNSFTYIEQADPNNYYNCSLTDSQLEQIQVGGELTDGSATIHAEESAIRFYYNETECYENVVSLPYENFPSNCKYMISVVSKDTSLQNKYTISIKGNKQHLALYEGQTRRSILLEYDSDYYLFENQDPEAIRIVFQLTVVSGEITVYTSQSAPFPDQNNNDRMVTQEMDLIVYDTNLVSKYYINVQSRALTRYTITALIFKQRTQNTQTITLLEGQTYKHIQTDIEEITQFQFQTSFSEPQPIFFHLTGIVGEFVAYITFNSIIDKTYPDEDNFQYKLESDYRTLIIDPSDQGYLKEAIYRVSVESLSLGSGETYEISYTTQQSLYQLKYGEPFYSSLDDTHSNYFMFQLTYDLKDLFIIKSMITQQDQLNNIKLYVSYTTQYPSASNYLYKLEESVLRLSDIPINSVIYIAVQSIGYNEFTLLIRGIQAISQLTDNNIQKVPMPAFEDYQEAHLYFQVPKTNSGIIQVQAYTRFAELTIYANLVDYDEAITSIRNNDTSLFPNKKHYLIKDVDTSTVTSKLLLLHQNVTNKCATFNKGCLLLISIRINQESLYTSIFGEHHDNITEVSNILGEDGYFSIQASSSDISLQNGQTVIGYSEDNIFSYYTFSVPTPVEMIQIMVRPLNDGGDPDIYLQKQHNDSLDDYPTFDHYDMRSVQYKSDVLILDRKSFSNQDNSGNYIIGITGFQEPVTFELSLTLSDIQIFTILPQQWVKNFQLNQISYFKYHHARQQSFRLLIQGINKADLAITTQTNTIESTPILSLLPFTSNVTHSYELSHNDRLLGGILHVDKDDSNFCSLCTYLIAFKPLTTPTTISILVAIDAQPLLIENGQTYIDQATSLGNHYYLNYQGYLKISVISGVFQLFSNPTQKANETDKEIQSQNDLLILINDPIYIFIRSAGNDSNVQNIVSYTISLQQLDTVTHLNPGKMVLGNGDSDYTFDVPEVNFYTIQLNHVEQVQMQLYVLDKSNTTYFVIEPMEISSSIHILEQKYKLENVGAYHKLKISTTGEFTILVSLGGLKYLQPNQRALEIVSSKQEYEIYAQQGKFLHLELINCIGTSELNSTLNSITFQFKQDQDLFFNVNPISYALFKDKEQRVVYNMVAHIQDHAEVDDLKFEYDYQIAEQELVFNITPIKYGGMPDLIQYTVHATNLKEYLYAFGGCAMDIESVKYYHFQNQSNQKLYHSESTYNVHPNNQTSFIQLKIKKPQQNQVYVIVSCQIYYDLYTKKNTAPHTYFYNQIEIDLQETNNNDNNDKNGDTTKIKESEWILFIEEYQLYILIGLSVIFAIFTFILIRLVVIKCKQRMAKKKSKKNRIEEEDEKVYQDTEKVEVIKQE